MTTERSYVLGTHDEEIARLGLQHSVWRPRASAAWQRAGFTTGHTLVDLGCGPGFATLELASIVGPGGRVIGLDRSRRFLDHLEARVRALGLDHVETHELDLDEAELPAVRADGVWARWVYSFVRDPKRLVERAAKLLRPGGVMVLHEYVDYRAWRMSPPLPQLERFVERVIESWKQAGGEHDVARQLPLALEAAGCTIRSLEPHVFAARPADHEWKWASAYVYSGSRRLVELGMMSEAEAAELVAAYEAAARARGAFQVTPTVLEVIAVRH